MIEHTCDGDRTHKKISWQDYRHNTDCPICIDRKADKLKEKLEIAEDQLQEIKTAIYDLAREIGNDALADNTNEEIGQEIRDIWINS